MSGVILDAVIYVDVGGVLSYRSGEEYRDVAVYGDAVPV